MQTIQTGRQSYLKLQHKKNPQKNIFFLFTDGLKADKFLRVQTNICFALVIDTENESYLLSIQFISEGRNQRCNFLVKQDLQLLRQI